MKREPSNAYCGEMEVIVGDEAVLEYVNKNCDALYEVELDLLS